jgi:hypothetical protein
MTAMNNKVGNLCQPSANESQWGQSGTQLGSPYDTYQRDVSCRLGLTERTDSRGSGLQSRNLCPIAVRGAVSMKAPESFTEGLCP